MKNNFFKGFIHGIPIMLGYLTVSFGFGIAAVRKGLSTAEATIISVTNLTSAGQTAGIDIIAAGGTIMEMMLSQLVINIRYALMSLSLSQKLDKSFTLPHRLLAAYGITDEIFAVAAANPNKIKPSYMYGLIAAGFAGWTAGTFFGAAAGNILPSSVSAAMGLMLYGMFVAIIIPPAREKKSVLAAISAAAVISVIIKYLLSFIPGGFAVIIAAAAAAALAAVIFPVNDEESREEA